MFNDVSILISILSLAVAILSIAISRSSRHFDQLIRSRLLNIVKNLIWAFLYGLASRASLGFCSQMLGDMAGVIEAYSAGDLGWGTWALVNIGVITCAFAAIAVMGVLTDLFRIGWLIRDKHFYSMND
jgi:hypothetical protein